MRRTKKSTLLASLPLRLMLVHSACAQCLQFISSHPIYSYSCHSAAVICLFCVFPWLFCLFRFGHITAKIFTFSLMPFGTMVLFLFEFDILRLLFPLVLSKFNIGGDDTLDNVCQ